MSMVKKLGTALVVCVVAASAAGAENDGRDPAKVTKALAKYERTGKIKNCINPRMIRGTKALDDYTILFRGRGSRSYIMNLERRCHGLAFENSISYVVRGASLCASDIFQVNSFPVAIPRAICGFTKFEELKKLPKDQQEKAE